MKTATKVARERQLDWLLSEELGGVTATGARAAIRPVRAVRRQRLFAAAILTLAAGAAFGVAWLRDGDAAKEAQQPQGEPEWQECHDPRELGSMPLDVRAMRCFDFDDQAIAALTKFVKLERLDLSAMAVNDQGYAVSLKITDAGLAHLGKLTNLRWLSLATCHDVKGTGLTALENLPQLEHLDLTYTGIASPAVERLSRLPSLRELSLSYCRNFHGRSLAEVAKIPGLRRLMLQGCTTLAAGDVAPLARLRELRYLDLRDCQGRFRGQTLSLGGEEPKDVPKQDGIGITDASIAALADLQLEWLLLGGSESLTDAIGETLAKMATLRSLDLSNLPKTTGALLAKVPAALVSLMLEHNPQFDGAAVRRLPPMPQLRDLGLSGLQAVGNDDLKVLLGGKSLQVLRLGGPTPVGKGAGPTPPVDAALTSAAASLVATQRELRRLDLANARWLDAAAMQELAKLPELTDLNLTSSSACTAACLAPLASSRSLRSLQLIWCRQLDVAALQALAGAPLQNLDLYGTNLKPDAVKEHAKGWPGCTIRMPGGQSYRAPR